MPSDDVTRDIESTLIAARDETDKARRLAQKKWKGTLLVYKTNVPGAPKNPWYATVHRKVFDRIIGERFTVKQRTVHTSLAGDAIFYAIDQDAIATKQEAIRLETDHPLGRYADLDVYVKKRRITRESLDIPPRSCFVCDQPAHACARAQTHSVSALRAHVENRTIEYLLERLTTDASRALEEELALHPKFGLVTSRDPGCHTDMNASHFEAAIIALKPWFKTFLDVGNDLDNNLEKLRAFGKAAEKAMFEATNGINTHKGAIFIFGAFLPFFMDGIRRQRSLEDTLNTMKSWVQRATKHDFDNLDKKAFLTAGERIYLNYGLRGIRGEVASGFPSVMAWYPNPTYNDYQKLCAIVSRLDDTTIIKRHNYTTLKETKAEVRAVLDKAFDMHLYQTLSTRLKEKGVSPGGSADLLALVLFLDRARFLLADN